MSMEKTKNVSTYRIQLSREGMRGEELGVLNESVQVESLGDQKLLLMEQPGRVPGQKVMGYQGRNEIQAA